MGVVLEAAVLYSLPKGQRQQPSSGDQRFELGNPWGVTDCLRVSSGHRGLSHSSMFRMQQVRVSNRDHWRRWLAENHDKQENGIWLVFSKKKTGRPSLAYEESVEEALCFGWVDSIIKRIDDESYCRKFTPRKDNSRWSNLNRKRVEKIILEGRMTEFGLAKITAAKSSGKWQKDPRPVISMAIPKELSEALARNEKAKVFFERLAPAYQKHFIGWIATAKRPETRAKRVRESLALLGRGKRLGLK